MGPYPDALRVFKSRTIRDQRGDLGYGWADEPRAGAAKQPFTDFNVRQRVPLVGAQRVDEAFAERSDKPQMNRRQAERTAATRDMQGKNKPWAGGFDDPPEELSMSFEGPMDEEAASDDVRVRRELQEMMGLPRPRTLGDEMSFKSKSFGPFNGAWSLLKQLTEEELAMAADPSFGGLGYSPERMNAMMAQGLDPAMAMGALDAPTTTPPPVFPGQDLSPEDLQFAALHGGLRPTAARELAYSRTGVPMPPSYLPPLSPQPRVSQSKPIGAPMPSMQSMPMTPAPTMSPDELAEAIMQIQQFSNNNLSDFSNDDETNYLHNNFRRYFKRPSSSYGM